MRVNQVANSMRVTPDTVRYYTRIGLLRPEKDRDNGYKIYGEADVRRLHFIIRARQLGFSIVEIKRIIDCARRDELLCSSVVGLIHDRINDAGIQLEEAEKLLHHMSLAVEYWTNTPDQKPTGALLCDLINNWNHEDNFG